MNEQLLAAHLPLGENPDLRQSLEIPGGSLTLDNAGIDDVADAAVRLLEQYV